MDENPNWVKARANCTVEVSFKALVKRIEADINRFNGLESRERKDRFFVLGEHVAHIFHRGKAEVFHAYDAGRDVKPAYALKYGTTASA